MNDIIENLARQSMLAELYDRYYNDCVKSGDTDLLNYEEIVVKFTQLIVEECAVVCQSQRDPLNDGYAADVKTAIKAMKQHFGV